MKEPKDDLYVTRNFYGPLEPALDVSHHDNAHNEYFRHPQDEDKLVRLMHGNFTNTTDMERQVANFRELLTAISSRGIAHVNPEFFDATEHGNVMYPTLGAVVDALPEHVRFGQVVEDPSYARDQQLVAEIDRTVVGICNYLSDTARDGGWVGIDTLAPHQFVYVLSQQKFVLTDIEPVSVIRLEPDTAPIGLDVVLESLAIDISELNAALRNSDSGIELASNQAFEGMVEVVSKAMPEPSELQAALLELARGGDRRRLDRYIAELNGDDPDDY